MAKSRYTRSGTRRLGDDYQDLVALDVILDWLEHTDRYEWIRLEDDDAGSLDDVVAMGKDGKLSVRQVKFSTNSEADDDPLTWDTLLAKPPGKSTDSLLEKWSKSLTKLRSSANLKRASVISNRRASAELAFYLGPDGIIDFDRLSTTAAGAEIIAQLDDKVACEFFSQFHFDLNAPGKEEFEAGLKRRFRQLGGTDHGWFTLREEVGLWVINRNEPLPDGKIRLHDIHRAAGWHTLRALPQGFEIPPDYVLPSEDFFEHLFHRLTAPQNSCVVLTASPGAGKSTFASFIWNKLREQNLPVIRHHYFLSRNDRSYIWRLDHQRAAESLMHDLKRDYPEALGQFLSENPHPQKLGEWVTACGQYYRERGQSLVVIIDGLDHVWRDKHSINELERLLDHLLPVSEGVIVLFATQPVEDSKLPPLLLREAPREGWQQLPLLSQQAVTGWLKHHKLEMSLPGTPEVSDTWLERVAESLYQKSGGHPLHLRYTLIALQEQHLPVSSESIRRLPGCPHKDITSYYTELWRTLDEEAREILHLMAACTFPWPQKGMFECLDPQGSRLASLKNMLRQVSHLLVQNDLGWLPFHGSLLVYIADLADHKDYAESLKRRALTWLSDQAPEHWKWSYEWLLEAELGNNQPLRAGPNRRWAVEAIANGRSPEEIGELLARSTWYSLEQGDLARAIETGLLRGYVSGAFEDNNDSLEPLLLAQLEMSDDPFLLARLRSRIGLLSEGALVRLATKDYQCGKTDTAVRCFDELVDRIHSDRHKQQQKQGAQIEAATTLAGSVPVTELTRMIRIAVLNRQNDFAPKILAKFSQALRAACDIERMRQLVRAISNTEVDSEMRLTHEESAIVFRQAVLLALEEGIDFDHEVTQSEWVEEPIAAVYAAVRGLTDFKPGNFEFPQQKVFFTRSYKQGSNYDGNFQELFYHIFFSLLANHLWGRSQSHAAWLREIGVSNWPCQFVQRLDAVAKEFVMLLKNGTSPTLGLLYERLRPIQRPDFREENDVYIAGYVNAATNSCELIGLDLLAILSAYGHKPEINRADLESAFSSQYCYPQPWITAYLNRQRRWLDDAAVAWLLETQSENLAASITPFPERTEQFAGLAAIAAIHKFGDEAQLFVQTTAENLIAHGYHKDLLYYSVFEAIKVCHQAGMPEARGWLLQLAAPTAAIDRYTDGDETGSLPREMADLLAEIAPDLLPVYLRWLTENEEFYDALHAFHAFLSTADLDLTVNQAVASTALDDVGLSILQKREAAGDAGAALALPRIVEVIGRLPEKKEATDDDELSSSRYEQQPVPLPNAYPPDQFAKYREALREARHYSDREIIQNWARFWIERGRGEEVFAAMQVEESHGLDFSHYDQMFDLALRFFGKERAYPWLVKAHKEGSGWSWAYTDKAHSVRRWEMMKGHYAERWYDFIRDTFKSRYGIPWQELSIGHYSFGRLVEYCIRMNQHDLAREVTGRLVECALEFVSPLQLAIPEWTVTPTADEGGLQKESGIDILFQRLVWPSLLVRERACVAIAELIHHPQETTRTQTYLLNWMKACELESHVILGLLVLHRARAQNECISLPTFAEINQAISKPSILSWMLLKEIFPDADNALDNAMSYSGAPPSDFTPDPQFEEYVQAFIPPLYDWYARRLEENELIAFRRQWAYEWSLLMKQTCAEIRTRTLDVWVGSNTKGERYGAVDTLVSEVYLSAYLRALAWAVRGRGMDIKAGIYVAAQTCQIDLELWRLKPVSKPLWWPQVVASDEELDSAPVQIWEQVETLWEEQKRRTDGWLLTHASGLIEAGKTIYELEISGFFQKTFETAAPSLDDISRWYREECRVKTKQKSLLRFQGMLTDTDAAHLKNNSGGWSLLATAGRLDIPCGLRWQYWRLYRGVWLPASFLGDQPLSFKIDNDGLLACDGNEVIGKWNDWCDGLLERIFTALPLRTGQFLTIRRDRIFELARVNKAAFCWVCCLTAYHRNESYQDYKRFSVHRVFGDSRLIL